MKNILNVILLQVLIVIYPSISPFAEGALFAQAGTLDATFGNGGIDTTIFGGGYGQSVFIQPDKKIVVCGGGYKNSIYGIGVVRYTATGSLDNTFGTNGKVYTDIGGISSWGNECARQSDGKIVVAGSTNTKGSGLFASNIQNFIVLRYNTDGSLDNTFGTNGSVVTGFNQKNSIAASMAIQTDGKIIAAGVVDVGSNSTSWDFALVRYNTDGSLDNAFGNSGKVTTDFKAKNDIGNSVKLQADGKIVVAGPVDDDSSRTTFGLARYNVDGSLDNTFGTAGKLMTSVTGSNDAAYSVAIQADGKLVVTGGMDLDNGGDVGLIRYNSNGSIDNTFGVSGIVQTHAGTTESRAFAVTTQADNKIIVAGVGADSGATKKFVLVIRYNSDGSIDPFFGNAGKVKTSVGNKDDEGYALAIQPDQKIVVAGWTKDANDNYNYAVVRYNGACDPPVVTTNAPQTICEGTNVTLTASGANTYTWSGNISNGTPFTPIAGIHTYTVIGTNNSNCKDTTTTNITVNTLPTVIANANVSSVCAGSSVTLTGTSIPPSTQITYSWTGGVSDGASFAPPATKTYTVTGTDANNCYATDSIKITVNALPIVKATASATTVCSGQPVTPKGTGASSYSWTDGIIDANPFISSSTQTYTLTGTDANNCSATDTLRLVVNNSPNVIASASAKTVCSGASVTLTGSGASSYTWSNGVTNAIPFTVSSTATYTVTGTDANNCSDTDTISIHSISFTVIAKASATTICAGDSVTLYGTSTPLNTSTAYSWTNGIINNTPFVPTAEATYTVTGTDVNNCSDTDTITIKISTSLAPIVTASASRTTLCAGESVTLTGSGANSYSWSNGVINTIAFVPASSSTYTLTGTDTKGCSDTALVHIVVNTLPSISAHASTSTLCLGDSVTLTGTGAQSYLWSDGIVDGIAFLPSGSATYTLTGTNAAGCSADTTIRITVLTSAQSAVTANANVNTLCFGASVILTGASTPPGGLITYSWTGGVTDGLAFQPTTTTTYTVTATNINGCSNSATKTITVNPAPTVLATASTTTLCAGDSVMLTGEGANTYTWTNNVLDKINFAPTQTKMYTVTGNNTFNCSDTYSIQIYVYQLPVMGVNVSAPSTTVCLGDGITLKGTGANTYLWSDNIIDNVVFHPTTTATYTVTGRDLHTCTNTASQRIVVKTCDTTIIDDINEIDFSNEKIQILPNPNNGACIIKSDLEGTFFILNELGQSIAEFTLSASNKTHSLENINNGIYFIIGMNYQEIVRRKMIVVH